MEYSIPYGEGRITFNAPERAVIFTGEPAAVRAVEDLEGALLSAMESPWGTPPLKELAGGKEDILFLIEDNTRTTPLDKILPVIVNYLNDEGVPDSAMSFLTAPGTHRVMTEEEILQKVGPEIVRRFTVHQHDATKAGDMKDMGWVDGGDYKIPVRVNKRALEADLLVGIGNIVPHTDAGYSGGAKILQPGVCDFATTSATHAAAGFCADIPLGMAEGNPCREGIEAVGRLVGLDFIINVVKNVGDEVAGVFAGDFVKAHREGVKLAREAFSIPIPHEADVVVVSSSPADLDFWQGSKAISCAYFAVKKGGVIILAAPCTEGLAHNHPRFREWLSLPLKEVLRRLRAASPEDTDADMVSAVLSVCNCRAREKARVFSVTEGLTEEDLAALQYTPYPTVQDALDAALELVPDGTVGIIPRGGIFLPVVDKK